MGRQPCCDKLRVKRGPWTADEDKKLVAFILANGHCCWRAVPKLAGLARCGKSCRLRWTNYLRPDLKRGLLTESEEQLVIELHTRLGNRWSKIAAKMPGRTDNEIKNHWNTHIKKKLVRMGIDPVTHQPLTAKQVDDETKNSADTSSQAELEPGQLRSRQDNSAAEDCSNRAADISCLLEGVEDVLFGDEVWKLSSNEDDAELGLSLDWLLDYQDFMMEDLGLSGSKVDDK